MFGLESAMVSVDKVVRSWVGVSAKALNSLTGSKITPNFITITGFIAHGPIAWLVATNQFGYAALGLVFFGLFDTLDGELARLQNKTSLKGMLLDASTDRMKEVLLYSGAVYLFASSNQPYFATWATLALGSSLCVSYIKAKGETAIADKHMSAQEKNRVFSDGLFRFELRMFVLVVGLVFGWLEAAVILITIGASLTAFIRLIKISARLSK